MDGQALRLLQQTQITVISTCSRVLQTSTGWVAAHASVAELAEHIASAQAGSSLVCSVPLAHCLACS
jgi:hypothetical protein